MDTAIIVFNVVSIIILGLMLLKGYISGLWKSLVSLGILIVGMIILFLCLNPIGNSIVNPESTGVIQDIISDMLAAEDEVVNPAVAEFILAVAGVIVKMLVLIVGMFVLICIIEPIISLIVNSIVFRTRVQNEEVEGNETTNNKKPIWLRLGGLGVKAVQFFIVMMGLLLPVFAVNSLVLSYEDTLVENNVVGTETEEIFGTLNKLDKSFVKAPVNAINSVFNTKLEINMFSSASVIKIGEQKINLIKEVYNAESIVGIVLKNTGEEGSTTNLIIDGKEALAEFIKESTLLETIYPLIINMLEENNALPEDAGVTYDDLKSIDFSKDKNSIADMIVIVGEYLEQNDIDLENPQSLLANEELPNFLKNIGEELADTTFMDVVMKLVQSLLNKAAVENPELAEILELLDLTKIEKNTIVSDMQNVGLLLNKIDELGIIDSEEFNILNNLDTLEEMANIALKLSIIEGSEEKFITYLFENFEILEGYNIDIENFDFDTVVSWEAEIHALFNLIEKYLDESGELNFKVEDLKELSGLIKGPNGEPCYFTNYIIGSIVKEELDKVVSDEIFGDIDDNYDLTDPEVFEEVTESLGAALEVGTSIEKMEDVENLTTEEITNICDTIANLDNYKSDLIYDLVVDLTDQKGINLDLSKEEFKEASLTKESEILEEILMAINSNVSDEELDKLVEKAEEETVIIKAFIEQYIK